MAKDVFVKEFRSRQTLLKWLLAAVVFAWLAAPTFIDAQNESSGTDGGSCTLRDHLYRCDSAVLRSMLASAKTVAVEVHNADGIARGQLTNLLTKKLDKTIAEKGETADLIFLMMPIDPSGIVNGGGDTELGTLRVYSPAPNGARGNLVWAETYSGTQDMPWPAVVHGLILQFESRFHIK